MYLTVKNVAKLLSISTATVYQWIDRGELIHVRLGVNGHRGTIRVSEDDLKIFLEARKTKTERPAVKPVAPRHRKTTSRHFEIPD